MCPLMGDTDYNWDSRRRELSLVGSKWNLLITSVMLYENKRFDDLKNIKQSIYNKVSSIWRDMYE